MYGKHQSIITIWIWSLGKLICNNKFWSFIFFFRQGELGRECMTQMETVPGVNLVRTALIKVR